MSRRVCGSFSVVSARQNKVLRMRRNNIWVTTFDGASCRVFKFHGSPHRLEEIVGERRNGPHKPHFDDGAGRVIPA